MKKILAYSIMLLSFTSFFGDVVHAGTGSTIVTVTEKIPGANCVAKGGSGAVGPEKKLYECTVEAGFGSVTAMFAAMIKYATYITALLGVLMFVGFGIMYMLPVGEDSKKKAKEHIMNLIAGLALLFLMAFILNTVAPWIYA